MATGVIKNMRHILKISNALMFRPLFRCWPMRLRSPQRSPTHPMRCCRLRLAPVCLRKTSPNLPLSPCHACNWTRTSQPRLVCSPLWAHRCPSISTATLRRPPWSRRRCWTAWRRTLWALPPSAPPSTSPCCASISPACVSGSFITLLFTIAANMYRMPFYLTHQPSDSMDAAVAVLEGLIQDLVSLQAREETAAFTAFAAAIDSLNRVAFDAELADIKARQIYSLRLLAGLHAKLDSDFLIASLLSSNVNALFPIRTNHERPFWTSASTIRSLKTTAWLLRRLLPALFRFREPARPAAPCCRRARCLACCTRHSGAPALPSPTASST